MNVTMNSRHKKTLLKVFSQPVSNGLPWSRIESLLVSIGAEIIEKSGSGIEVKKDEEQLFIHRPHPRKEAKPYQVRLVCEFLTRIGVTP